MAVDNTHGKWQMAEQGLKEKIAKHIFHELHPITDIFQDYWGITGTMDDESWRRLERHCFYSADQILTFTKEAGYVLLPPDSAILENVSLLKDIGGEK